MQQGSHRGFAVNVERIDLTVSELTHQQDVGPKFTKSVSRPKVGLSRINFRAEDSTNQLLRLLMLG